MAVTSERISGRFVGRMGCDAIRKAGQTFKMRCELDGEYKIGGNWSETH